VIMSNTRNELIWRQFGASLDMLQNAIYACPDEVWGEKAGFQEYWYMAFHALFWTDLYLHGPIEGFRPPEPYGLEELDPSGVFPERIYSKQELTTYVEHCRSKLRRILSGLTDEGAAEIITHGKRSMSFEELLLYNMRHVQHHAAQLNLLLRQSGNSVPGWVSINSKELSEPFESSGLG
jgi:hypothetical protein